jgi:hypothetical protein
MKRHLLLILLCFKLAADLHAQSTEPLQDSIKAGTGLPAKDSIPKKPKVKKKLPVPVKDTAAVKLIVPPAIDSLSIKNAEQPFVPIDYANSPYTRVLKENPYYNVQGKPVLRTFQVRKVSGKEGLFYLFAVLFFLLAVLRVSFGKYFQNLFTVFFRASMKQKQIREQLLQTPLPSLLLNLLFVTSAGLYAVFILHERANSSTAGGIDFWLLYAYSIAGLTIIYLGKYFVLKMLGWTLKMVDTTDTYIFIVFLCNKIMAIVLLPLLLIAAFADTGLATVSMTIASVLIIGLFLYRYISSYGYISREVRTSRFHFFLYLCAFEVAPLLLIYKGLLKFV